LPEKTQANNKMKNKIALIISSTLVLFLCYRESTSAYPPINLKQQLQECQGRYKILYETYRVSNFEIFIMNPDGSNQQNLTNTPDIQEFYPQASPDGTKICFMAYQGQGQNRIRCLYLMNPDGTGRKKIVDNGRWPCWSPDGRTIAFVRDYLPRFNIKDYATQGLYFYDLQSQQITEHPNCKNIQHIYCLSWHPNGRWIAATVHGGLGQDHAIITLARDDNRIYKLLGGNRCRPVFSPEGDQVAWCDLDWAVGVANLRLYNGKLNAVAPHQLAPSEDHEGIFVYHPDWSPDGKLIAFCRGPVGPDHPVDNQSPGTGTYHHAAIGVKADGWDIYVVSSRGGSWLQLTTDGHSNKEPNWIKVVNSP